MVTPTFDPALEAPMRILLIEDDEQQAHLLTQSLIRLNHADAEVELASCLSAALAALSSGGFDAVLMDLMLPDSDGLESFRKVHAAAPSVPIVVFTGIDDESCGQRAVHEGAQDYLIKGDVTPREVIRAIRYSIERSRALEHVRESEERFRLFVEGVKDCAIVMLDSDGRVVSWNPGAERILGYSADEIIGRHFSVFYPVEDVAQGKPEAELREALSAGNAHQEGWRLRKDGTGFWAEIITSTLRDAQGGARGFARITRDVTERKRASEEVLAYQERLRELAAQLSVSEERERRRIATRLHDDVGQTLAAIQINIDSLPPEMAQGCAGVLGEIRHLTEQAVAHTRSLTFDLSPPILYEVGLDAAIEWLAAQMKQRYRLNVSFESHVPRPLGLEHEFASLLFQVIRELCMNIAKHAKATNARVALDRSGELLKIRLEDDGKGFDPAEVQRRKEAGFGLFNIRERLAQAAGSIAIDSAPGKGTRIEISVPHNGAGHGS
jgi:PAS domain S-box-containing protein